MARGWESKSVEMQMEERGSKAVPAGGNAHADAGREREVEVLELSRKHLLHEIENTSNPRLLVQKQRALRHVETQIAALLKPGPEQA